MDTIENTTSVDSFDRFCSYLAQFSFFVFLLLNFFGLSMPFQEKITDAAEITTASPINQFVFSTLYILSFVSILPKRHLIFQIIKAEKFLTIFLIWSFITVFWSYDPFVSFKRWFRISGMTLIMVSALLHLRTTDDTVKFLKIVLAIYIPLSVLSILLIPGATMYNQAAWRGIAVHKNTLGQISLVSLIIWSYAFYRGDFKNKVFSLLFCIASLILLIGSKSVTSILTAAALLTLAGFLFLDKKIFRPVVGGFISSMFFIVFSISLIPIFYFAQDALASLPGLLGKDLTFSGRTYLWADVFDDAANHLLIGCGIGGYWIPDSPAMDRIWGIHYTLFNQAHLGYLDILNETGLIGIVLFACMVIFYFINFLKINQTHFWVFFILSALVSNLQESSLFRPLNLTGVLFILSYLVLYVDKLNHRYESRHNG